MANLLAVDGKGENNLYENNFNWPCLAQAKVHRPKELARVGFQELTTNNFYVK